MIASRTPTFAAKRAAGSARPTVMFHVQHFLGIGHLVRAFALAESMASRFRVVVVSGGRFPAGIVVPDGVELVTLPALGFDQNRMLVSHHAGWPVERVLGERRRLLLEIYERVLPDVVLVELFPFGRKKLAPELSALLTRARSDGRRPITATSVRDLLVTGRRDQQRHDDRAAATANTLIDLVLVHGDRRFAELEQSFVPSVPFEVPVAYTGFVAGREDLLPDSPVRPGTVVVSAGGGWVGGALLRSALAAAPIVKRRHGLETTVITGPLADDRERQELRRSASEQPCATVIDSVSGLLPTLRSAAASVSQAGYNTTVDLLRAGVPAVLVPYGDERENEQRRRAARMADHGVAQVLDPAEATGTNLADALAVAIDNPPPSTPWALDGGERTASILGDAVRLRQQKRSA